MTKSKIHVKIAVSVDPTGEWCAMGWSSADLSEMHNYTIDNLEPGERRYWIEADLEIPSVLTLEGEASNA